MPEQKKISDKSTLVYVFWWLQWTVMQLYIIHHYGFSWKLAVADSLITNLLLTGLLFAMNNVMRFYQPYSKTYYLGLVWNFFVAFISVMIFKYISFHFFTDETVYLKFISDTIVLRFCFALLLITCSSLISWIWSQMAEIRAGETRKSETEKLARESELMRLRQQLQPHFLFNSLNSISALTGARPEEARKMIQQLSDFLRSTLKQDDSQMISLDEEMKNLNLYLEIEKVRFGHRLNIEINYEGCRHKLLPALLMQPLVENSIKFGLYNTVGDTLIKVNAVCEKNNLVITVSNPFDADSSRSSRGTGFGLSSLERRLYLLFGRNDLLTTSIHEGSFETKIIIPQL